MFLTLMKRSKTVKASLTGVNDTDEEFSSACFASVIDTR
jgi:hypothetical protein